MRKITIYTYYVFGYNHNILRRTTAGGPVHGEGGLTARIDEFFGYLKELELAVTEVASSDLKKILVELKKSPKNTMVDKTYADRVNNALDKIDTTLDAEMYLRHAYLVTPKRFPLKHLLDTPSALFAKAVADSLPEICRFDFLSTGQCIAFDLPTAAAFHIMRCTEGVLRFYYCMVVKRNRIKSLLWGPIVQHLRSRRRPPPKSLLDNLDNIRDNFRNPTQHPDARYDSDEAQDLLAVSIDVINRMIKDLKSRGALS